MRHKSTRLTKEMCNEQQRHYKIFLRIGNQIQPRLIVCFLMQQLLNPGIGVFHIGLLGELL